MKHKYFIPETDKEEIWKDICRHEGLYKVSTYGRVMSFKRKNGKDSELGGFIMCPIPNGKDYLQIKISNLHESKTRKIHRLVAETFIANPDNLPTVNHIDGNKRNNHVDNLEWSDHQDQMNHAIANGLINQRGRNHSQVKLTESQVIEIRNLYIKEDLSYVSLGKIYNVNHKCISSIIKGETWIEITKGLSIEKPGKHSKKFPTGYSRWHFKKAETKEFLQKKYLNK